MTRSPWPNWSRLLWGFQLGSAFGNSVPGSLILTWLLLSQLRQGSCLGIWLNSLPGALSTTQFNQTHYVQMSLPRAFGRWPQDPASWLHTWLVSAAFSAAQLYTEGPFPSWDCLWIQSGFTSPSTTRLWGFSVSRRSEPAGTWVETSVERAEAPSLPMSQETYGKTGDLSLTWKD